MSEQEIAEKIKLYQKQNIEMREKSSNKSQEDV